MERRARRSPVASVALVALGLFGCDAPFAEAATPAPSIDATAWSAATPLAVNVGGELVVLSAGVAEQFGQVGATGALAFSPDGAWLAVERPTASGLGSFSLALASLADGSLSTVAASGVTSFSWTSGGALVYTTSDPATPITTTEVLDPGHTPRTVLSLEESASVLASPDGSELAVSSSLPVANEAPTGEITVYPTGKATGRVVERGALSGFVLESWWPDGGGLVFGRDPLNSASVAADGMTVLDEDLSTRIVHDLGTGVDYAGWSAYSPDGTTLAITLGASRTAWADKSVARCTLTTGTCETASTAGPGDVAFGPAFDASGELGYVTAHGLGGEFGLGPGMPDGPRALAVWESTNRAVTETSRKPVTVAQADDESLAFTGSGQSLVVVHGGGLWFVRSPSAAPQQLASSLGPQPDLYGYRDWGADFALAPGAG